MSRNEQRVGGVLPTPLTRREFLALAARGAIVAAAGGTAVACGEEASNSGAGSAPSGKLLVWDWHYGQDPWGEALKKIDENFMKANPEAEIEHVAQPVGEYDQIVQSAFTGGSGPDVVMFYAGPPGVLNYADALSPLNDRINEDMREQMSGWDQAAEDFDANKNIFGVPTQLQGIVFYYNKPLFEKAGLDPESPPGTYDELVAAAEALKGAGIVPFGGGNKEGALSDIAFSILWPGVASMEETYDLALGELSWTSPKVLETHQRYIDLIEAGYFPEGLASTALFPTAVDSFAAGDQAMFIGLASDNASHVQFNPALGEENVGVFQAPGVDGPEVDFLPAGPGAVWSIPAFSENQDAAFEWIKYATGPEGAQIQYDVGGVMPINKQVDVGEDASPQVKQIVEDFASKPLVTPHGIWKAPVLSEHGAQFQLVIEGRKSVREALEAVQAAQDKA